MIRIRISLVEITIKPNGSKKFSHCPNPIGHIIKDNKAHNVACKGWSCQHCKSVSKYNMLKRFENHKGSFRYRMITLTEWKEPSNYENSKQLSTHYNKLKSSLKKHGINLNNHTFWVKEYKQRWCEFCKKDCFFKGRKQNCQYDKLYYPHMHILIKATIDYNLISYLWYLATNRTFV